MFDLSGVLTYPGYFLHIKHTKTRGNEKCSRSEEFDLAGS